MGDLRELIEKLERLDGPSREVDLEIARAVLPDVICMRYNRETRTNEQFVHWQYTASLDAAIALCERVLPGWHWHVGGCPPDFLTDKDKPFSAELMGPVSWAVIDREVGEEPVFDTANAQHSSPAVAICLATLRALSDQDTGQSEESGR